MTIFATFLKLGCISFGGPAAHLGYFRDELVSRRRWLDEESFVEIVALTQLLPGPSSSQTGFLVGISQAGISGGFAAWLGFTLPSAILMLLFAAGVESVKGWWMDALLHGLQTAAIAVVAHAVWSMFRRLCPDAPRAAIACASTIAMQLIPGTMAQITALVLGAAAGLLFLRERSVSQLTELPLPVTPRQAALAITVFTALFIGLETLGPPLPRALYRTGALVFGGGHVVLPLLEEAVVRPRLVDVRDFLGGYGAAQAVPGPLFSFGAFLGYVARVRPNGVWGGCVALVSIFMPGLLLAIAASPFWSALRRLRWARSAFAGVNAAVVGLLFSALLHAVRAGAVANAIDAIAVIAGFMLLLWKVVSPAVAVVLVAAIGFSASMIR